MLQKLIKNSAKFHIALFVASVVFLGFVVRMPAYFKEASMIYGTTEVIATKFSQRAYFPYYEASLKRVVAFYSADEFPRNLHIYLVSPVDVYEPFSRAELHGVGGYAVYDNSRQIVINTSKSEPLVTYKVSDRRIFYYVDNILVHEIAHQWANREGQRDNRTNTFIREIGWKKGFPSLLPYYYINREEEKQSKYGLTNPDEDLAETVENMFVNPMILDVERKVWFYKSFVKSDVAVGLGFPVPEKAKYLGYSEYVASNVFEFSFASDAQKESFEMEVLTAYNDICEVNWKIDRTGYWVTCGTQRLFVRFGSENNFFVYPR